MVMDKLIFIEDTLKSLLPNDVKIYDIVYRPFDMNVFGSKGYSIVLTIPNEKIYGVVIDNPTNKNIKESVKRILNVFKE